MQPRQVYILTRDYHVFTFIDCYITDIKHLLFPEHIHVCAGASCVYCLCVCVRGFLQVTVHGDANMNICARRHVARVYAAAHPRVSICVAVCMQMNAHGASIMTFSKSQNIWAPSGGFWHHRETEYENVELSERTPLHWSRNQSAAFEHDSGYTTQPTSRHKLLLPCNKYHKAQPEMSSFVIQVFLWK